MKKVLALTLVLVLALGMSTVAFAVDPPKIIGEAGSKDWYTGSNQGVGETPSTQINPENDLGDVFAGDARTIGIDLKIQNFSWKDQGAATQGALTTKMINDSGLTLRLRTSKGSQVIDKYELVKKDSKVEIKFVENFVNNNKDGVAFAFAAYLTFKDGDKKTPEARFEGTFKNRYNDTDYGADTDYYYFGGKEILIPTEFIRAFDGELGDGVHFNMRGIKGAKYYAYAKSEVKDSDQDILIKYAAIDEVYHVYTAGNFASVVNYVTFEDSDPTAYVYDKDLNLLGRANQKITTLSDTYYLASAALDVDTAEEEPDEGDDEGPDYEPDDWGDNSTSGGDDLYPENPHDNPGTGK